jgi:lysylphosphatidylglycerol synthetase-like protein (DUF2156 family)
MPRPLAGVLAVLVFALIAALALGVAAEVRDRRRDGFCRPDHGIPGATRSEERTFWPLGDRCHLRLADGSTRVREPGWWLTALVAASSTALAVGAAAPPDSARRRLAWAVAVPALPVAAVVAATVQPRSLARLVSLTSISLGYSVLFGAATALVVWLYLRGRALPTILGSWLAWAVVIFLQGKDSIGS